MQPNQDNLKSGWNLRIALLAGFLFGVWPVWGQGWEQYLGGNKEDFATAVLPLQDEGYLITGYSESFGSDSDMDLLLIRTDVDGEVVWLRAIDEGFIEKGWDAVPATDGGGYVVVGDIWETPLDDIQVYLFKVNENGDLLWSRRLGGAGKDMGLALSPTPDGGYIVTGVSDSPDGDDEILLLKTDALGNQQWLRTYGFSQNDRGNDVLPYNGGYAVLATAQDTAAPPTNPPDALLLLTDADGNELNRFRFGGPEADEGLALALTKDGNFLIGGATGNNSDFWVLKVSPEGDILWEQTLGGDFGDRCNDLLVLPDGSIAAVGGSEISPFDAEVLLARLSAEGQVLWTNLLGRNEFLDEGFALRQTPDGGFVVVGINSQITGVGNDISLLKTDSLGNTFSHFIEGRVVFDQNLDCEAQPAEQGLREWLIKAVSDQATFVGSTDAQGFYSILVDTGTYDLILLPKNDYWEPCQDTIADLHIDSFYDSTQVDFPVQDAIACPLNRVDVSTPFMVPCQPVDLTLSFCNEGTTPSPDTYIEVLLDPLLTFNAASLPPTTVQDSFLRFDLGTLPLDTCGTITLSVTLSCEALQGETIEVLAHIFPDSLCTPPDPNWDGASIAVSGTCEPDSVRFEIKNIGDGDMQEAQDYIIVEDIIVGLQGQFQLDVDEALEIGLPADGTTYRIVAMQSPGHPGNNFPTLAVEGCGTPASTGFVTQLPENEADPFRSLETTEAETTLDAFSMRGYPKGYFLNDTAFIQANTDIEYHVRFQNTTSDTVRRVVIRDTLPPTLELGSLRLASASHPVRMEAYDRGLVKFIFENINLPPLDPAQPESSTGFLKFKIAQRPDLPPGTEITNRASIYLGYEAPIRSIAKTHYVGGADLLDFAIVVSDRNAPTSEAELRVYPNPFRQAATFEIDGVVLRGEVTLSLYDSAGRLLRRISSPGNRLQLSRGKLPKGLYFFRLENQGRLLGSGKVLAF